MPGCLIGDTLYEHGDPNPDNPCETCTEDNQSDWTQTPIGESCGDGNYCADDGADCTQGCLIDGEHYDIGTANPDAECEFCTGEDPSKWSPTIGFECDTGMVCDADLKCSEGCYIDDTFFDYGDTNPTNGCQACSATAPNDWTGISNIGDSCDDNSFCNATFECVAGCLIDGTVVEFGSLNPTDPCQTCHVSNTGGWTPSAPGNACGAGNVCDSDLNCTEGCLINGHIVDIGTPNPDNPCQACTAANASGWSGAVTVGDTCASGMVCNADFACVPGCFIGSGASGEIVNRGTRNPAHECESCTDASATDWSFSPVGTECGESMDKYCNAAHACVQGCFIKGVVYLPGTPNPDDACNICDPANDKTDWTPRSPGDACGIGKICDLATLECVGGCVIKETQYNIGDLNDEAECEICSAEDPHNWTTAENGIQCDVGMVCSTGGTCVAGCFIDGILYSPGDMKVAGECGEVCDPSNDPGAWSQATDGLQCDSGSVCMDALGCVPGCFIDDMFVGPNTTNSENECEVCGALSTEEWTPKVGDLCQGGTKICDANAQCVDGCVIGGIRYEPGAVNEFNVCEICDETTPGKWTPTKGLVCDEGKVCDDTFECTEGCFIGGAVVPYTTENSTNPCEVCTAANEKEWTKLPARTPCGGTNICDYDNECVPGCTIGTSVYFHDEANSASDCEVCDAMNKPDGWTPLPQGGSCGSIGGKCSSVGECVESCNVGGVIVGAGQSNPTNECEYCDVTNPTTWAHDPAGAVCGDGWVCDASFQCQNGCLIGGTTLVPIGEHNGTNLCQTCTAANPTDWTIANMGEVCGGGMVCDAVGGCAPGCFIEDELFEHDDRSADTRCFVCTDEDELDWTPIETGKKCDEGKYCAVGDVCVDGCMIGGWHRNWGYENPSNRCEECSKDDPEGWTSKKPGDVCNGTQVCDADLNCVPGCVVGGIVYGLGDGKPGDPCSKCTATGWGPRTPGEECGTGQVCNGLLQCNPGCYISGVPYNHDASPSPNSCLVCASPKTDGWSLKPVDTSCGGTDKCNAAGECVGEPGCTVAGGGKVPNGAPNPANPCEICKASDNTWVPGSICSGNGGAVCDPSLQCSNLKSLAGGSSFTCGITQDGSYVYCWGRNDYGQLGDGTTAPNKSPRRVTNLPVGITAISVATHHACAITSAGQLWCWGNNAEGRLGIGSYPSYSTAAMEVTTLSDVKSVSAGGRGTCALVGTNRQAYCWGYNSYGRVGDGSNGNNRITPSAVTGSVTNFSSISTGDDHTCALTSSSQLFCWGFNSYGQIGNGDSGWTSTVNKYSPQPVQASAGNQTYYASAVSVGRTQTCAITTSGGAVCWGYALGGVLGNGNTSGNVVRPPASAITGLASNVSAIHTGYEHTCARVGTGVRCWGANGSGQLGTGTPSASPLATPQQVSGYGTSGVDELFRFYHAHTCIRTSTNQLRCWGNNDNGQLGNNPPPTQTYSANSVPVFAVE
ncbi:MAG: hypothetical protein FWD57_05510 [Polyangiaceae bacterium]|nr:hypothetical protein [Polyangiaceae bacterium]